MTKKRKFRKIDAVTAEKIWSIVEKNPIDGWKGVTQAERETGISRETIYKWLKEFPEPVRTRRKQPEYITEWKESKAYAKILRYNRDIRKVNKSVLQARLAFAVKCWLFHNKRNPLTWTIEDFRELQNNPAWINKKLRPPQMPANKLGMLRNFMVAFGHHDWLSEFPTRGTKGIPAKKHWYFRKQEVQAISKNLHDFSAHALFIMACKTGNRIGTFLKSTFKDLHLDVKDWETWDVVEEKTVKRNTNELSEDLVILLKKYISFMKRAGLYGSDKKIFPKSKQFYIDSLREAARKAGLTESCHCTKKKEIVDYCIHGFPITWHITRHTFASLNAQLLIPLQHIMDQGPWADAKTLLDFYAGLDRQKVRESMNKLKIIDIKEE